MKARTKSVLRLLGLYLAAAPALITGTTAAFTSNASNLANSFTADNDWVGPPIPSSIIQKDPQLLTGGFIRSNSGYRVYANVGPDSGNPATGISTVTANVAVAGNVITAGQTAVALMTTGGPWTINGTSYAYRTASLTAGTLTNANRTYSITASDLDTPANVVSANFSVTGDITQPQDSAISTANGGGILGRMQAGDSIIYTFSEQIEPESILVGWTGSSTNIVVRVTDGTGGGGNNNDHVQIWNSTNTTQLPLGRIRTGSNAYISGGAGTFGASGTPSTMVMTSPTVLTVTFGTAAGTYATVGNATLNWRSSDAVSAVAIIDRAGNALGAGNLAETGGSDPNF